MSGPCPVIGFSGVTDINWYGNHPQIGFTTTVVASLHNLSPLGYASQPGQVLFRWLPLGWTADYCSTPVMLTALNSPNPAEAMGPGNVVLIAPQTSLPATIAWTPGPGDVGSAGGRGQILCQGTALYDIYCPKGSPPDCSSMPYNLASGSVNVYGPQALAEVSPAAMIAGRAASIHLGFAIANTAGIPVRITVSVDPLGPNGIPSENVRFELGKGRFRIAAGKPTVLHPSFYAGLIPERIFEDLVLPDAHVREGFGLEAGELRQGLLEITVPEEIDRSTSVLQVTYKLAEDGRLAGKPFGSFTVDVGEYLSS